MARSPCTTGVRADWEILMRRSNLPLVIAALDTAIVFSLAFLAAPRSCEGGLTLYFWAGVASVIVLIALPFIKSLGASVPSRVGYAVGFAAFGVAVWIAGLFLANVRIMCRLF